MPAVSAADKRRDRKAQQERAAEQKEKAAAELAAAKADGIPKAAAKKEGGEAGKKAGTDVKSTDPPDWKPVGKKKLKALFGGVVHSQKPKEVGQFVLKEWQDLPRKMLREYCQKQKRPNPQFQAEKSGGGQHRCRVLLPDSSGKPEKDITICTAESFPDHELALEMGALLALHHFTPTLPLERKLPEPFGTMWSTMRTNTPGLSRLDKFTSQMEQDKVAEAQRQTENEKKREETDVYKHLVNVFMSDTHRQYIEGIIAALKLEPDFKNIESTNDLSNGQNNDVKTATLPSEVRDKLVTMGFHALDIDKAAFQPSLEHALEHLYLSVPEHRLPRQLARGTTMEVVNFKGQTDPMLQYLGHGRMGFPQKVCEHAVGAFKGDVELALLQLFRDLFGTRSQPPPSAQLLSDLAEELENELVALESIYEESFVRHSPTRWTLKLAELGTLDVVVPKGNCYPEELPVWVYHCEELSPHQRLYVVRSMATYCLSEKLLGSPLTHTMVEWLQTNRNAVLASSVEFDVPLGWKGLGQHLSDSQKLRLVETQQQATQDASSSPSSSISPSASSSSESKSKNNRRPAKSSNNNKNDDNNARLVIHTKDKSTDPKFVEMCAARARLPAFQHRDRLLSLVDSCPVVVISGETGCGKSTQVPQFILEHFESKGAACSIVCTQPRRISAIGLAERVATERGETCGDSVGYRIRMESKTSRNTRLVYATTGILLRQLQGDPNLGGVTHVIVDEVHERTLEIDFLLIILKMLLRSRPTLRVILMSATVDADRFVSYFSSSSPSPSSSSSSSSSASGSVPWLTIPGRTFPVSEYFLEDVLELLPNLSMKGLNKGVKQEERDKALGEVRTQLGANYSDSTVETVALMQKRDKINYELCASLIWHITTQKGDGAILVFLPGVAEISKLSRMVEDMASVFERSVDDVLLLPLHGSLSSFNQQRIFGRPPSGVRKVVLATNIAETSITVEDVLYVIDCGKVKEMQFSSEKKMSMLVEAWVAQSNATQRKGRAGRVRAGFCYRLYSRARFLELSPHQLPELHRSSLDHVCLQAKLLTIAHPSSGSTIEGVLGQALDPPPRATVDGSVAFLSNFGALDSLQNLTPLGQHLASLPIQDVRVGKLLLYGAIFSCLRPAVVIAALLSSQSIWAGSSDREQQEILKAKYSSKSDHLAAAGVYEAWLAESSRGRSKAFCEANGLKESVLDTVKSVTKQYLDALSEIGFVGEYNSNSEHNRVVCGVLCAALYPNVVRVEHPAEVYVKTLRGAVPASNDYRDLKYFTMDDGKEKQVYLHASSGNAKSTLYESPWLVYLQAMELANKPMIMDCTMVYPYALLLFGGRVGVDLTNGLVSVDEWIKFKSPGKTAILVRELRRCLDQLLVLKIKQPKFEISSSPVVSAILRLLTTNGQ